MKNTLSFYLVVLLGLPLLGGCNIYAPIAGDGEPLEKAISCLHKGDFACAIEAYNRLPDGNEKLQKLCTVRMAQAGFSLSALIDIFNNAESQGAQVLGAFANALLPYSAEREEGAAAAVTACNDYQAATAGSAPQEENFGVLLRSLSLFLDCAVRMAKTDTLVADSTGETACNTPGNGDGVVDETDIGPADGDLDAGGTGMCPADVIQCATNIGNLSGPALNNAELSGLSEALNNVPPDLIGTGAGENAIRSAIRQTVQ